MASKNKSFKLSFLAETLGCELIGEDKEIVSLTSLDLAGAQDISFLIGSKMLKEAEASSACALIADVKEGLGDKSILFTKEPQLKMAELSALFAVKKDEEDYKKPKVGKGTKIYPGAYVSRGASVGENCTLYPGVFVDIDCEIGDNVILYPNVSVLNGAVIKDRVIVHAGAAIGSDGYGYAHTREGKHVKIHHFGRAVLEENVEIGANTTVDRGVFADTVVKSGAKIDNLVMIAHNCEIGENTLLVGQVGISGSTKLGKNVIMGGQSGTVGHIKIGDFAMINGRGGVTKDLEGGKSYAGYPLMEQKKWLKHQAKLNKLTEDKNGNS